MRAPSREQLAWLAGLIEGEGWMHVSQKSLRLKVGMTDEDVIRRIHAIVGAGTVNGPYANTHGIGGAAAKPMYFYNLSGDRAYALLIMLWEWFGLRRRDQVAKAFVAYATLPLANSKKRACIKGHPFDEINTYRDKAGKRHCRPCRAQIQRDRRARKAANQ